jgi:RNA polymerase sigma-70 factor (ECF subfamily)
MALPWLYGVARKVIGHQWRSARRRQNLIRKAGGQGRLTPPIPEDVVVEHADHVRVRSALALLKEIDREVLILSAWEGLSHAQIAAAVGITLAAVDKRLTRAKKRLARQFDHLARVGESPTAANRGVQ